MTGFDAWIEYLKEPLVLVGFGLLVFASVVTLIMKQRHVISDNARLAVKMLYSLALVVIVGGFWLAGQSPEKPPEDENTEIISVTKATYGNRVQKDVTDWFSTQCDGVKECTDVIRPYAVFGDHEIGVPKGLKVNYNCINGESDKAFHLPPFVEPLDVRFRLTCS